MYLEEFSTYFKATRVIRIVKCLHVSEWSKISASISRRVRSSPHVRTHRTRTACSPPRHTRYAPTAVVVFPTKVSSA